MAKAPPLMNPGPVQSEQEPLQHRIFILSVLLSRRAGLQLKMCRKLWDKAGTLNSSLSGEELHSSVLRAEPDFFRAMSQVQHSFAEHFIRSIA